MGPTVLQEDYMGGIQLCCETGTSVELVEGWCVERIRHVGEVWPGKAAVDTNQRRIMRHISKDVVIIDELN